jgi:hypothetical protein
MQTFLLKMKQIFAGPVLDRRHNYFRFNLKQTT